MKHLTAQVEVWLSGRQVDFGAGTTAHTGPVRKSTQEQLDDLAVQVQVLQEEVQALRRPPPGLIATGPSVLAQYDRLARRGRPD